MTPSDSDVASAAAMRADQLLLAQGLVESRTEAQNLISKGRVSLITSRGAELIKKSSQKVSLHPPPQFAIKGESEHFVSRGGLKMQGALHRTNLSVQGFRVLDIGISTGGFADCVLQAGAAQVVGIDVGHGQLARQLKDDTRVLLFEGVNARDLSSVSLLQSIVNEEAAKFDALVVDVSFISLSLVLPEAIQYLKESGVVMALVKPQFEVGREGLGKNGIVKEASRLNDVQIKILALAESLKLKVEDYFESSIEGGDGNREFFLFARRM